MLSLPRKSCLIFQKAEGCKDGCAKNQLNYMYTCRDGSMHAFTPVTQLPDKHLYHLGVN